MSFSSSAPNNIVNLLIAKMKDDVYRDCINKLKEAQRLLLEAEVGSRREKSTAIIKNIGKIEFSLVLLKISYSEIENQMTQECCEMMQDYMKVAEQNIEKLKFEKGRLSRY